MQIHNKSDMELKTHLGNGLNANNLTSSNLNMNSAGLFSPQRRAAVHDLTQILVEDCQKVCSLANIFSFLTLFL
jgi:hypothetical protein